MKKTAISTALACLILVGAATASLPSDFRNPPPSAKARTWWHWINGNVTKEGITADLEAMKRVGIQEAQLFNVDQGYPEGSTDFLTAHWLECFQFAASEAQRLGLELGFNNCAGWSNTGGPWITPQYGMQTVTISEKQYAGGLSIQEKLPQPASKLEYYRDIVVLAFPTPQQELRIDNLAVKTLSTDAFANHVLPDTKSIPPAAVIRRSDVINLSSKMSADGVLTWKAPAGQWTVLRIGHTPTGSENRPANLSGRGLECDKLSRKAMDQHWAGAVEPILKKLGPLVGPTLTNCLVDSYEVGCGNWTQGFDSEFAKRRSYDCISFLPTLAGYYVESGELSERFLWDFRKTIGEMMTENHYDYFRELCHKRGMKFSVEPYGGPFDCLEVATLGDIPMSEFWVGGLYFSDMSKLAASAAHLNGTSIVGAEAFTSANTRWLTHPATMKAQGDWAWSEGVNRFIFHTYAHQPWNVAPGLTFHMYGTESRLNTWWEQGHAYMEYLARSQFLLQQGRCVADVLVFTGESSPNNGMYRPDIKALGYDYDEIGCGRIASLTVKEGRIHTSGGGVYRLLVLPESKWMTLDLLMQLKKLAERGAVIIGPKPMRSPTLQGFPQCDTKFRELTDELWGVDSKTTKTAPIRNISVQDALNQAKLSPDFSGGASGADLLFIHRIAADADIYFVANSKKYNRTEQCRFRVTGKQPERWNSETGEIELPAAWWSDDEGTTISLNLDSEESCFILFREPVSAVDNHLVTSLTELSSCDTGAPANGLDPHVPQSKLIIEGGEIVWITPQTGEVVGRTASGATKRARVATIPSPQVISGAWDVSFPPKMGAPAEVQFDSLYSWSESAIDGVKYFSGTATYRKQIEISEELIQEGQSLQLDLGEVCVMAEVIVNGKNLGIVWKAPFRIDLGDAIQAGLNRIEIHVTNLWPNRLIGDARYPEDCEWGNWLPSSWPKWLVDNTERDSERITFTTWRHWRANDALQPSGLLGPVILRHYVHVPLSEL